ncbi:two component system response regulator [Olivibacter ginsenosidimutans]|uniref:Two component system response regulator n=1 Tax=Olivibacter ginsenosidimutans TaxID=1176537 RepID=A0ABP9B4I4_9SPHI
MVTNTVDGMSENIDLIKLAIVDDHQIVIQGLKNLLVPYPQIQIEGSFTNGMDVIHFLQTTTVDVVLLDVMLPGINGMELCKEIKMLFPQVRVLALSNHAERSFIMQMLQNGASGYLLKNVSAEKLVKSIYELHNGEITFSKEVKEVIAKPSLNELRGTPLLTKREKQILGLIAEGKTTTIMADELCLSPLTIETHRRNLLQKFAVRNVAELIKEAIQQRIL